MKNNAKKEVDQNHNHILNVYIQKFSHREI